MRSESGGEEEFEEGSLVHPKIMNPKPTQTQAVLTAEPASLKLCRPRTQRTLRGYGPDGAGPYRVGNVEISVGARSVATKVAPTVLLRQGYGEFSGALQEVRASEGVKGLRG